MNVQRYLFFICGQIGMMSLARFFFQWILKYADNNGLPIFVGGALGGLLMGFRLFDGVTDPLAGDLSDRWVRNGRQRQRLLWFSAAVPALGLALCFLPSPEMAATLRWTLLAGGMFAFFVGYTFYAIPYWSLVDDYSAGDHRTRRVLSNLLGAGMILATAIGFGVSPFLVGMLGYSKAAVAMGIGATALMLLPVFAAPQPGAAKPALEPEAGRGLWNGVSIALRHRRFLALIALFSGSQMSFTIMTAAAAFITVDLLGGTEKDVVWVLGPLLIVALPCFLLVPKVSARIGWERGMLCGSLGLAVVYLLSGTLGQAIIGTPMLTASLVFALGGPMVALLMGLEPEGVVDCAREKGEEYVGIYWGVFNFIVKILNGAALWVAALLSQWKLEAGLKAVRAMSFAAGGCLLLGVACYVLVKRRTAAMATSKSS